MTPDDPLYKKDRTSLGIHGLAGNAAEFTSDTMRDENRRLRAIVKGGSYIFFGKDISQSYNLKVIADQGLPHIGFRCALDLLP
ncbi:MAG: SUMF1/EgtB/PvdO family nonheme iron enzyme [Bacteroidales bacterium]